MSSLLGTTAFTTPYGKLRTTSLTSLATTNSLLVYSTNTKWPTTHICVTVQVTTATTALTTSSMVLLLKSYV